MNYSTAIFLINPNVRTITAIYEREEEPGQKPVPREIFKSFDATIKKGDLVLVPTNTRHNVTIVKVVDTDTELDIETTADIRWVIGPIGDQLADYQRVQSAESDAINKIKQVEANHRREELKKKLLANVNTDDFKTLRIASMGNDVGDEPKDLGNSVAS